MTDAGSESDDEDACGLEVSASMALFDDIGTDTDSEEGMYVCMCLSIRLSIMEI